MANMKGVQFVGGNERGDRIKDEFYPTPDVERTVHALLGVWCPQGNEIWEPACGNGAMSKVLEAEGYDVSSSDLVDRGYGVTGQDYFASTTALAPCVITNPPWNLARKWALKTKELGIKQLALLLPTAIFASKAGLELFTAWQPKIVAHLTWRLDFLNKGSPVMTSQWVVWDDTLPSPVTKYVLLRRPS